MRDFEQRKYMDLKDVLKGSLWLLFSEKTIVESTARPVRRLLP